MIDLTAGDRLSWCTIHEKVEMNVKEGNDFQVKL